MQIYKVVSSVPFSAVTGLLGMSLQQASISYVCCTPLVLVLVCFHTHPAGHAIWFAFPLFSAAFNSLEPCAAYLYCKRSSVLMYMLMIHMFKPSDMLVASRSSENHNNL